MFCSSDLTKNDECLSTHQNPKFQFTMARLWDIEEESLLAEMWQTVHEFHHEEGPF